MPRRAGIRANRPRGRQELSERIERPEAFPASREQALGYSTVRQARIAESYRQVRDSLLPRSPFPPRAPCRTWDTRRIHAAALRDAWDRCKRHPKAAISSLESELPRARETAPDSP